MKSRAVKNHHGAGQQITAHDARERGVFRATSLRFVHGKRRAAVVARV